MNFKKKWVRIVAILGLVLALYTLAGFLLVPRVIRHELLAEIRKNLPGIEPAVGKVSFNPLLLQLQIADFSLSVGSGEKLLGFRRLFIDFQISSLWHRAYTFKNIDLGGPFVNAIIAKDGRLNLTQLSPKRPVKTPEAATSGAVPALRIGSFSVRDGVLAYEDRSRASGFASRLEPISFALNDFTTGVGGGLFNFTGVSKLGERFEWHGHVSVQPISSDGEFQIDGLRAHTIWEYLEDRLNFLVDSGSIDLHATYKFALRDAVELSVDASTIAAADLTVRPKGSDADWISLPKLLIDNTHIDLAKQNVHVDSLTLNGLKLTTWMDKDGSFNLMQMVPAAVPSAAVAPASVAPAVASASAGAATAATAPNPPLPWTVALHEFSVRDASIAAEDRRTIPVAKLIIAPLAITVTDASSDLSKPLHVNVDAKINEAGSVRLEGEVTPQPLGANLSLTLAALDLPSLQPYIAQRTSMTLLSGALGGDFKLRYGSGRPAADLSGNLYVTKLHTVDNALHDDFINWDRLEVQGLEFQHDPDRLDITQVSVRKAYGRIMLEPDSTLNVSRVLAGPGATVVTPAPAGTGQPQISATAPPAASPARTTPTAAAPLPMLIKKISLEGGEVDFADLSLMPNFSAGIQKLHGTVLGLSSKTNSRAKIDLNGEVDAFSPVAINGEANLLGAPLNADLVMSFHNIELTTFNPYSGKFAGYAISKGKLTTDLHYKVEGRKLDAQHHVVVDQLEFGDRIESKQAVSLPLKLAVSLLKNREGVIDLNIPVNGSLDDPQFKLAPIIWKVLVNILERAVTAPFALLGSLFGGGPDLQFIDFEPGMAELDADGAAKAQTILKALSERPQLKIDVPIAFVADLDRDPLIEAQLTSRIKEAQSAAASRDRSMPRGAAFEQLDGSNRLAILTEVYRTTFQAEPKYPDSVNTIKVKSDSMTAKIDYLTGQLRNHMQVGAVELNALGQQRAANLQELLLKDSQIDPERVFLVANDKAKAEGGKVRLELSLR